MANNTYQPIIMDTSDLTKTVAEMLEVKKDADTLFFVLERESARQ